MTDNELRRQANQDRGGTSLVRVAGVLMLLAGVAKILYSLAASFADGWSGGESPFKVLSVFIGVFEMTLAAGILNRRAWARALGLTLAALGIGLALIGILVHGLTVARDEGSGYLMLGFLGSYSFIVAALAAKGSSFRKGDPTW